MILRLLSFGVVAIDHVQFALARLRERVEELEYQRARWFACLDCGVDTFALGEYYMVWPDVWAKAGVGVDDGMLCIGCLERRIGRRLGVHDFTAVPVNFDGCGPRVRSRILGTLDQVDGEAR